MRASSGWFCSKQSGVSEVVKHALKGDFWDTDEMANKILSLVGYQGLAEALAENAKGEAERLTWTDADNFVLEATITDPTVFSRPWTMRVAERRRPNEEMWESACFEGMTDPDKYLLKTAPPPPTN